MRNLLFLLCIALLGCQSRDLAYYQTHPEDLFKILQHCTAETTPPCDALETLAAQFRSWALELKRDPQAFGQKVLTLQSHCTAIPKTDNCYETLTMQLALIKWLESPER